LVKIQFIQLFFFICLFYNQETNNTRIVEEFTKRKRIRRRKKETFFALISSNSFDICKRSNKSPKKNYKTNKKYKKKRILSLFDRSQAYININNICVHMKSDLLAGLFGFFSS